MNGMNFIFALMVAVFVIYVTFIWIRYGVQKSISDSYYRLSSDINFLFTFFCWGFAIPAIIIGTTLTDNVLMFLAGSGIGFVGAAAAFKEKMTKTVHMAGAYTAVALSQISIGFDFHQYYVNAFFLLLAVLFEILSRFGKMENKVWWQEILAFVSIVYVFCVELYF